MNIQKNDFQTLTEVIICEDEESNNLSKNVKPNKTTSFSNSSMETVLKKKGEDINNNNSNMQNNYESYFCYKNTVLYRNGIHLQNNSINHD